MLSLSSPFPFPSLPSRSPFFPSESPPPHPPCHFLELGWVADVTHVTSACITWLLYAFYTLLSDYFYNDASDGYTTVIRFGVPSSVYFLLLSAAWMPHFVLLLLANNPFRKWTSFVITAIGILGQHVVAARSPRRRSLSAPLSLFLPSSRSNLYLSHLIPASSALHILSTSSISLRPSLLAPLSALPSLPSYLRAIPTSTCVHESVTFCQSQRISGAV